MANAIFESSRGYDIIRLEDVMLTNNREIFFTQEVNAQTCDELKKQLIYLDRQNPGEEIVIYINSPGGSVQDGLSVVDIISLIKSPVRTVCFGTCASMGAIIFLAGYKREIMEHGRIMIHDPAFSENYNVGGKKPHELAAELDDLNRCRESLAKIIAETTCKSMEEIYAVTAKDSYYNCDEALEFGLATDIIKRGA